MAKYSNTVEYQIKTTLDSSGLNKLQTQLEQLRLSAQRMGNQGLFDKKVIDNAVKDIQHVQRALNDSFNGTLGMIDTKALMANLTSGGRTLNSIFSNFSALGTKGTQAFVDMYRQIGKIDQGMMRVSSTTDKIMNTFGNTFR